MVYFGSMQIYAKNDCDLLDFLSFYGDILSEKLFFRPVCNFGRRQTGFRTAVSRPALPAKGAAGCGRHAVFFVLGRFRGSIREGVIPGAGAGCRVPGAGAASRAGTMRCRSDGAVGRYGSYLYPTPLTVTMRRSPIFCRNLRIWTSIVRSPTTTSLPQMRE